MRKLIIAMALFVMASAPAFAQRAPGAEEMAVGVNWGNLQNSVAALIGAFQKISGENEAMKKQLADVTEKCGAKCKTEEKKTEEKK